MALALAVVAPAIAQPSYKVSAERLQQALSQRFPARYPVRGLLDLDVQTPQLRFLPERNRLGAQLQVQVAGPALRRSYTGAFDIDFALRYEPSDQTIRAHQLQAHSLRLPGMPAHTIEVLNTYLPALAQQSVADVVVHRLQPKELALADTMGLRPDSITVTADGLVIGFAPRTAN